MSQNKENLYGKNQTMEELLIRMLSVAAYWIWANHDTVQQAINLLHDRQTENEANDA